MIYPDNFEEKINFVGLRQLVSSNCISPLGILHVERMCFSSDFDEVNRLLHETDEMLSIIIAGLPLPLNHVYDVTSALNQIKIDGGYTSAKELHQLALSLTTISKLRDFFIQQSDDGSTRFPYLNSRFSKLAVFPNIIRQINSVIASTAEVNDNASPHLADIRNSLRRMSGTLSSVIRKVMEQASAKGILDKDATPTMRDGRLVLPVAAMSKRKISGIIHDESASGKTVFIEPSEVVEFNNRIRELENEEKREVIRILAELSDYIRPYINELALSFDLLGECDFIHAKARVARHFDAQLPQLEKEPQLELYHAIHPVLQMALESLHKDVVPIDINLNKEDRILIISGPNAGGKSVCLKTVGIIQYMLQCGMLPTIYSNSHVSIFKNILIDIGDEQSIEMDLSTYSSHLRNMKVFLQHVSPRTLVLADEMGSGTEPQIGGALAQSIISKINKAKAFGVITTHYQNLKTFAEETKGLINGAMLYDRQKMQPTFQLSIGYPGSSFAVEIARKIGLSAEVIDDAERIVGSEYVNMDKYLLDLARDRRYWSNKRVSIRDKEKKLNSLLERYELKNDDIDRQKKSIINDARREAEDIVRNANARIEKVIREIKEAEAEKETTRKVRRELEEYKRSLDKSLQDNSEIKKHKGKCKQHKNKCQLNEPTSISVGDYVRMSQNGTIGKVVKIEGKKVEVLFGVLRTIVDLDKLIKSNSLPPVTAKTTTLTQGTTEHIRQRQLNVKQEIDMRGMRVDEALQALTYFLDDALQFNLHRVRILHGTGTGALRMVVREQLQANPNVTSFRDEDVRFGGAGITVVELD